MEDMLPRRLINPTMDSTYGDRQTDEEEETVTI